MSEHTTGAAQPPTQFALSQLTLPDCAPPELARIAAEAGYDFISPRIVPLGIPGERRYALATDGPLLARTREALAETGLSLREIEVAAISDTADPGAWAPALEIAAELGARHVLSSVWTRRRAFAVDAFSALCERAAPLGLTVDLEFVPISEIRSLREALAFLREAGRPNAGVCVDAMHLTYGGYEPADLDAVPAEWLHFLHLCDGPAEPPAGPGQLTTVIREARLYPGEGGFDLSGILARLPPIAVSVEVPNHGRVRELGAAEHARRCLARAREVVAHRARQRPS